MPHLHFSTISQISLFVICLISLSWNIPMTLAAKKASQRVKTSKEVKHIGLDVCMILFSGIFGLVAGILVLISSSKFLPEIQGDNLIE